LLAFTTSTVYCKNSYNSNHFSLLKIQLLFRHEFILFSLRIKSNTQKTIRTPSRSIPVHQTGPRPLPSTFLSTFYSLIVLFPATGTVLGSQHLVFKNYDISIERSSLLQNITITCKNEICFNFIPYKLLWAVRDCTLEYDKPQSILIRTKCCLLHVKRILQKQSNFPEFCVLECWTRCFRSGHIVPCSFMRMLWCVGTGLAMGQKSI
jgi:hypothetical protein